MTKERPILFSAPMVRALLAGTKTQTRRVFKAKNGGVWPNHNDLPGMRQIMRNCPYGQPGDRLWVRESGLEHRRTKLFIHDATPGRWWTPNDGGRYGASYSDNVTRQELLRDHRVRPSIHMPRWASRILLEVTAVRVERLQDISEADAIAEGCAAKFAEESPALDQALQDYRALWESINGAGSWDANPWVWVVEFKRVEAA